MSADLHTERYVRTPFVVEATVITEDNIDEIGKLIGETKVNTKNGEKYIAIDRRVVPNITRAYLGWYFTHLNDNYRVYNPKTFQAQFVSVGDASEVTFDLVESDGNDTVD